MANNVRLALGAPHATWVGWASTPPAQRVGSVDWSLLAKRGYVWISGFETDAAVLEGIEEHWRAENCVDAWGSPVAADASNKWVQLAKWRIAKIVQEIAASKATPSQPDVRTLLCPDKVMIQAAILTLRPPLLSALCDHESASVPSRRHCSSTRVHVRQANATAVVPFTSVHMDADRKLDCPFILTTARCGMRPARRRTR